MASIYGRLFSCHHVNSTASFGKLNSNRYNTYTIAISPTNANTPVIACLAFVIRSTFLLFISIIWLTSFSCITTTIVKYIKQPLLNHRLQHQLKFESKMHSTTFQKSVSFVYLQQFRILMNVSCYFIWLQVHARYSS